MDLLQHPLVQSLVVPLLLALAGAAVLRFALAPAQGARWAGLALGLGVLAAATLLLPWRWPATALVEKLPWCLAAAWLLGAALEALRTRQLMSWIASKLLWLALSAWIGWSSVPMAAAAALVGAGVLGALHAPDDGRATAAAAIVVTSLALAATAFIAGSLLLMQLSLLLAAATGGVVLWLWPRARIRFAAGAAVMAGVTWLALAQTTALLTPAPRGALLLLALGFAAAPIAARCRLAPGRSVWIEPLIAAVIAAAAAGGAVAWTMQAPPAGGSGDDPYYQPRWN